VLSVPSYPGVTVTGVVPLAPVPEAVGGAESATPWTEIGLRTEWPLPSVQTSCPNR
jgi:hypothetical protein